MKPELAVLPAEVWADVFVYPWISRRKLAQIVHRFGERTFAEKLQYRLHDIGKHTLHNVKICWKPLVQPGQSSSKLQLGKRKIEDKTQSILSLEIAAAWTEQLSSAGKRYYYNSVTNISQWEMPVEWKKKQKAEEKLRANSGSGGSNKQHDGDSSSGKSGQQAPANKAMLTICTRGYRTCGFKLVPPNYKDYELPESEMPENIKKFQMLQIGHLDDDVLAFLDKIKPLFTNVTLGFGSKSTMENVRILMTHLLPMLRSIRTIAIYGNNNEGIEPLERHFPGTLATAKELYLSFCATKSTTIPTLVNWLNAPENFGMDGPRFLMLTADSTTIFAIVDAVRKQFLAATTCSTFVCFLEFHPNRRHNANEFNYENVNTKEQLIVQNTVFNFKHYRLKELHYVQILRHPMGANAKMQEWIKQRAYWEKIDESHNHEDEVELEEAELADDNADDFKDKSQEILIGCYETDLTIGRITKNAVVPVNQGGKQDKSGEDDEAGPSTSAKQMKK